MGMTIVNSNYHCYLHQFNLPNRIKKAWHATFNQPYIDGLMQEWRNSSANTLELADMIMIYRR